MSYVTAGTDGRMDPFAEDEDRLEPQQRPSSRMGVVGWVVYWVMSVCILGAVAQTDRSFVVDNENYVSAFLYASWESFFDLFDLSDGLIKTFFRIFTEEAGWRLWCAFAVTVLNLSADQATLCTVVLLNLLVILGASRTSRPIVALLVWLLSPIGFALVGFFQIRQGFAFGILVFCAACLRRPILGVLLASVVHTTASVMIPFCAVSAVATRRPSSTGAKYTLPLAVIVPLGMAAAGRDMFMEFGGRRVDAYDIEQGATSINFIVQCILTAGAALSVYLLGPSDPQNRAWTSTVSLLHLQTTIFVSVAFFLFPIGTARVSYYVFLLLVLLLGEMSEKSTANRFVWLTISVSLIYQAIKQYALGGYNEFLRAFLAH
jgi:hypothetical protein